MTKHTLQKHDLMHFTGTENYYRHSMNRNVLYTDGVQYMAEHGGAYWLLDLIALQQKFNKKLANAEFQSWTIKVNLEKATAKLTATDGNTTTLYRQNIPYTDFPLDEINLFYQHNILMLPSEY